MKNKSISSVFALILGLHTLVSAQPTYQASDNSRQINMPDNKGNININNYLNKSDDYKALTKQLEDIGTNIKEKKDDCAAFESAKMTDRLDKCRLSLEALNKKQDSVANIIKQFKEDVIRLAETFKNATDKSQLFQKARALFEEGKFREANFLFNAKELAAMGEDGLEKAKTVGQLFLIKAQTKALDYADPLRIDSTAFCYRQSLRYADAVQTLFDFAQFFKENNLYDSAFLYYPQIIAHPEAEDWHIGNAYISLIETLIICSRQL